MCHLLTRVSTDSLTDQRVVPMMPFILVILLVKVRWEKAVMTIFISFAQNCIGACYS